jgi:hypothetical protein
VWLACLHASSVMICSDVHISNNIVIFCRQYRGLSKRKELENSPRKHYRLFLYFR